MLKFHLFINGGLALQGQRQIAIKCVFFPNKIGTSTFWTHNRNSPCGKQECLQDFKALQLVVVDLYHSAEQLQTDQVNSSTDHRPSERFSKCWNGYIYFHLNFHLVRPWATSCCQIELQHFYLWADGTKPAPNSLGLWSGLAHLLKWGRLVATICNIAQGLSGLPYFLPSH